METAVRIGDRQPVLHQQNTACQRGTLHTGAADIQPWLINTAEEILHQHAGLIIQCIMQRRQPGIFFNHNQVGAARDILQFFFFLRGIRRETTLLCGGDNKGVRCGFRCRSGDTGSK